MAFFWLWAERDTFLTANGERQTKYTTLYGWDCESIVILNDKCIKNYKLLKE